MRPSSLPRWCAGPTCQGHIIVFLPRPNFSPETESPLISPPVNSIQFLPNLMHPHAYLNPSPSSLFPLYQFYLKAPRLPKISRRSPPLPLPCFVDSDVSR
jgi:hypothetical protein